MGLSPTMPHSAAGWRMEPPVSVPSAHGARPAATAAALPPEEPPGTRARSHGLRTVPKPEFSLEEPIANSSWLVFASSVAPASAQAPDGGGGVRRQIPLEDARARLAGHALGAEQILDRERHAAQRSGTRAVLRGRALGDPREAVQPLIARGAVGGGALAVDVEQLTRGQRPVGDRRRRVGGGQVDYIAHPDHAGQAEHVRVGFTPGDSGLGSPDRSRRAPERARPRAGATRAARRA